MKVKKVQNKESKSFARSVSVLVGELATMCKNRGGKETANLALNIVHQTCQECISEQDSYANPNLIAHGPTLPCFSCDVASFHHGSKPRTTAIRTSTQSTGLGQTAVVRGGRGR